MLRSVGVVFGSLIPLRATGAACGAAEVILRWAAMSQQQIGQRGRATVLGVLVALLSGCSVFYKSTRPVPGASRNLSCLIEYRPSPTDSAKRDLLFLATASPYKLEEVYMNPVDILFHGVCSARDTEERRPFFATAA